MSDDDLHAELRHLRADLQRAQGGRQDPRAAAWPREPGDRRAAEEDPDAAQSGGGAEGVEGAVMEAGISDHVRSAEEIAGLADYAAPSAGIARLAVAWTTPDAGDAVTGRRPSVSFARMRGRRGVSISLASDLD